MRSRSALHVGAQWVVTTLISVVFLTFVSPTTSWINTTYGGDSALFRVIGSAMREGQTVYVDIWDHKGPALFFVQWLGQVIAPGRLGLFALQVIALSTTLFLVVSVARRMLGWWGSGAAVMAVLVMLSFTLEGGNLSEEYSLPFIMLAVYGAVAVLDEDRPLGRRRETLLLVAMGAGFAFVFLMRANNAFPIAGVFFGLFLQLLIRRRPWAMRLLTAFLGFVGVLVVFIVWFAAIGALDQMLDAAIWFNLRYAEDATSAAKPWAYLLGVGIVAVLTVLGVLIELRTHGVRHSLWLPMAGLGVASVYTVWSPSTGYAHYLTVVVPALAAGVIFALAGLRGRWQIVVAIVATTALLGVAAYQVPIVVRTAKAAHIREAAVRAELEQVLAPVPAERRDEVFTWTLPPNYFLLMDVLPSYKYFTMQTWWGSIDPQVITQTAQHVEESAPQWVLTRSAPIGSAEFEAVIAEHYVEVGRTDDFVLYERR